MLKLSTLILLSLSNANGTQVPEVTQIKFEKLPNEEFRIENKVCFSGVSSETLRKFITNADFTGTEGYWGGDKSESWEAAATHPFECSGKKTTKGRKIENFRPIGMSGPKFNVHQVPVECRFEGSKTSFLIKHFLGIPSKTEMIPPYLDGNMVWQIWEENGKACIFESFNKFSGAVEFKNKGAASAMAWVKNLNLLKKSKFDARDILNEGHFKGLQATSLRIHKFINDPKGQEKIKNYPDPCNCGPTAVPFKPTPGKGARLKLIRPKSV